MLSNRRWKAALSLILVLCLFASIPPVLPLQAKAAVTTNAGVAPDHVTLTWTQDPQTTQTVTWRTGLDTDRGRIQYAKQVDHAGVPANAQTASSTTSAFNTNIGNFNIHSVTATKLDPGTVYVYRVGDGTNWSEIHAFTTEAATTDAFKFLIFGDRQSGRTADPNYSPWRTCVQNAFKANSDASFIVNMGDMVETGQDYKHWENWFAAAKGVIDTIPEMAVEGNHTS